MGRLLKSEIVSNIFKNSKKVEKFEIAKDLSDSILSYLEFYPITERAVRTNAEITDEYNLYMVIDNLSSLYGLIEPWFSSKGDAEQIKLWENSYIDKITSSRNVYQDSCKTLIDESFLLKVAQEKENRLPMLYGGTDK